MKYIFAILIAIGFVNLCLAQPAGSGGGPSDPGGGGNPFDVPISGIAWLFVAGGIFGARAIYRRVKHK